MAYNIEYQKIDTIEEFDADALFTAASDQIGGSFRWNPTHTFEDKKNFYLGQLQSAIDGKWTVKNDTDKFLMYKIVTDGDESGLTAGFIETDKSFRIHWYLSAPIYGNRNWLYTPEARVALKDMLSGEGLDYFKLMSYAGGTVYKTIKNRANSGYFTIVEEGVPTYNGVPIKGDGTYQPVIMKIEMQ